MALVIGIDPATGSTSDTGFSVFDTDTLDILYADKILTSKRLLHHRIKEISDVLDLTLHDIDAANPDKEIVVCIESFVIRGKGGESLQRIIGSFMGRVPYRFELTHAQNTTVKVALAGHGHADKMSVAVGLRDMFKEHNKKSGEVIEGLILKREFDILDSLAIGVAGWQKLQSEREAPKVRKPRKLKVR